MSVVLSKEFRELAEKAERKWGIEAQRDMMIEECAELIKVLSKRKRIINGSTIYGVIGELVDVEIMLGQMKHAYGLNQELWSSFHKEKVQRLKEVLK